MKKVKWVPAIILSMGPLFIILTILLSITYGAKNMDVTTIWNSIFHYDSGNVSHAVVLTSRLPRALGALLVGAFLAISGAIMQGMTRNYLASPSIMGVTDGSVFVITICMAFLPNMNAISLILFSMIGSLVGAGLVYGFALLIRNGLSPVRLAIIGTVIGTFLSSVSNAIASFFQVSQNISFWYNARLHQLDPAILKLAVPFGLGGILLALVIAKSITVLSLGEEVSINLGQRTNLVKCGALLSVVILTGTSVAIVGKIGFVGLIIPHITRFLVGVDYKWIIPCAGVLGAVFLGLSDVISRMINAPFETPIGVVTSLIGVPFFLYLIRTRGGRNGV